MQINHYSSFFFCIKGEVCNIVECKNTASYPILKCIIFLFLLSKL